MIAAIALFGLVFPFVVQNPQAISDVGLSAPSGEHLLGTTQTGQDVFAQLAYATRGSLLIGVVGALVGGFLGSIAFGKGIGSFWSPWTWLLAFVGSVIVLAVWGAISGRAPKR